MLIYYYFLIALWLFHQSSADLEQKCMKLNKGDSSCTLKIECNPNQQNLTIIDIYLNKVTDLDANLFQDLNIFNLVMKNFKFNQNLNQNLFEKTEYIENFSLINVENLLEMLNNSFLEKKVTKLIIKSSNEIQIDGLLKIVNNLKINKIEISDIRAKNLTIDLTKFDHINELSILSGFISHLTIILNRQLSILKLFRNNINDLKLFNVNSSKLEELGLEFNELETISNFSLPNLNTIFLDYNKIRNFSFLKKAINLREIILISNNLNSSIFDFENVELLYLNSNYLDELTIFRNMMYLKYLYLDSNNFKYFTNYNLDNTSNIECLDLMNNLLEVFDLKLPSLKYLYLSHNFLKILDIYFELTFLDLYENAIESFSFKKIDKIELNSNQLKNLSKQNLNALENITEINLSFNLIENIEFTFSESITILNLYSNKLKVINKKMFKNLVNLELLNLDSNMIEYIEPDSFTFNSRLEKLSLSGNLFYHLPELHEFNSLQFFFFFSQKIFIQLDSIKILSKKKVILHLEWNNFYWYYPRLFCFRPVNYEIYFSEVDNIDSCTLKQLSNISNFTLNVLKASCKLKYLSEIFKFNLKYDAIEKNCLNFIYTDKCNENIFDCSKDIRQYEKTNIWGVNAFNISNILIKNKIIKVFFEKNDNFNCLNIEIWLPRLNQEINLNISSIQQFNKELRVYLQIIMLKDQSYLIFEPESKIFILMYPNGTYSFSIIRLNKSLFPQDFVIDKNEIEMSNYSNQIIDFIAKLDLDVENKNFSIYNDSFLTKFSIQSSTGLQKNTSLIQKLKINRFFLIFCLILHFLKFFKI